MRLASVPLAVAAATVVAGSAACGAPEPGLTAGRGIRVEERRFEVDVRVDPGQVPVADCAPGALLRREGDTFACVSPADAVRAVPPDPRLAPPDALAPVERRLEAVEARASAPRTCRPAPAGARVRNHELGPASCRVWLDADAPDRHNWWVLGPVLKLRPSSTGRFHATCPIVPRVCDGSDGVWSTLTLFYLDPDGRGLAHEVSAILYRGDEPIGPCTRGDPSGCVLSSNQSDARGEAQVSLDLGDHEPDLGPPGSIPASYRLELTVFAADTRGETQLLGAEID